MAEAARWYEAHRPGLGMELSTALDEAVAGIVEMPRMGSPVQDVADGAIRRRAVRRFPYHVIDLELPDRLQILAIAHDRRRRGYWVGRVAPSALFAPGELADRRRERIDRVIHEVGLLIPSMLGGASWVSAAR